MSVTCYECKDIELPKILSQTMDAASGFTVFNLSTLHIVYDGSLSKCMSFLLSKISSESDHTLIISGPDTWMNTVVDTDAQDSPQVADSDSDDSDTDETVGISGSSRWVNMLFALVSYFNIFNTTNQLVVFFNGPIPKKLRPIFPHPVSITCVSDKLTLDDRIYDISAVTCICVRSRKTQRLRAITIPSVWIYPQDLISCELGESMSIVRKYFAQASKLGGAVVFDDADLVLNTSGRIVREIIDEIGICLTEFHGKVFFVFSCATPISSSIMNRVDRTVA